MPISCRYWYLSASVARWVSGGISKWFGWASLSLREPCNTCTEWLENIEYIKCKQVDWRLCNSLLVLQIIGCYHNKHHAHDSLLDWSTLYCSIHIFYPIYSLQQSNIRHSRMRSSYIGSYIHVGRNNHPSTFCHLW